MERTLIGWKRSATNSTTSKPNAISIAFSLCGCIGSTVVAASYIIYHLVDPLPPRRFVIAAGAAASGYDALRGNTLASSRATASSLRYAILPVLWKS